MKKVIIIGGINAMGIEKFNELKNKLDYPVIGYTKPESHIDIIINAGFLSFADNSERIRNIAFKEKLCNTIKAAFSNRAVIQARITPNYHIDIFELRRNLSMLDGIIGEVNVTIEDTTFRRKPENVEYSALTRLSEQIPVIFRNDTIDNCVNRLKFERLTDKHSVDEFYRNSLIDRKKHLVFISENSKDMSKSQLNLEVELTGRILNIVPKWVTTNHGDTFTTDYITVKRKGEIIKIKVDSPIIALDIFKNRNFYKGGNCKYKGLLDIESDKVTNCYLTGI